MEIENFVFKQLRLLELEREAEMEETRLLREGIPSKELERLGICIRKLRIGSKRSGLYGRTLVTMEPQWNGKPMPAHSLTSGDIVGVTSVADFGHQDMIASGVVWATTANSITVAFDESLDTLPLEQSLFCLMKLANDVTYRRIRGALEYLKKYTTGFASRLIDVLFLNAPPSEPLVSLSDKISDQSRLRFFNTTLDESQQIAVDFAIRQRELAIIHGPPGTGKTTTLVEVIRQSVALGLKVLACAPANVPVDNLVGRLSDCGMKIVRLGHPARSLLTDRDVSLDALVSASDAAFLVNDILVEVDEIKLKIRKSSKDTERRQLRNQMKLLSRELRTREVAAVSEVLRNADVVLSTLAGSYSDGPLKHLERDHFDLVVIDECSQALEAACWISLLRAPKCVLIGDHRQLSPVIVSEKAAKDGLNVTLMARLLDHLHETSVKMLTTQYRMNETIMKWPSRQMYDGLLTAHPSVKDHLLCDLPTISNDENTSVPIVLIDTSGCDMLEISLDDSVLSSRGNVGEAQLVAIHAEQLIASGLDPKNIALIAPYNLQVELLRSLLSAKYPTLEIKTVDGFQGREKEAVILTLVRSNETGDVGFLSDDRRINVAITRARRHLAVICDGNTVSKHPFLGSLIEYMYDVADVRSAHRYQTDLYSNKFVVPGSLIRGKASRTITSKGKDTAKIPKVSDAKPTNMSKRIPRSGPSDNEMCPENVSKVVRNSERDEAIRQQFKEILQTFVGNRTSKSHVFPPTLNSFERRLVHELAEKMNLVHSSCGVGDQRYVTVSKLSSTDDVKVAPVCAKTRNNVELNSEGKVKAPIATKPKAKGSTATGKTHNGISSSVAHVPTVPGLSVEDGKPSKKRTPSVQIFDDEDETAILEKAVGDSKKCRYPKCKVGVVILGQVCPLCKMSFCLGHHLPEVHGCGDAARALARQRIRREKVIVPGSGPINRQLDPLKRAQLERKLEKKMSELSCQRNRKKLGDKK